MAGLFPVKGHVNWWTVRRGPSHGRTLENSRVYLKSHRRKDLCRFDNALHATQTKAKFLVSEEIFCGDWHVCFFKKVPQLPPGAQLSFALAHLMCLLVNERMQLVHEDVQYLHVDCWVQLCVSDGEMLAINGAGKRHFWISCWTTCKVHDCCNFYMLLWPGAVEYWFENRHELWSFIVRHLQLRTDCKCDVKQLLT